MDFLGLNWSSLIVYFALALIGIWVCYSFLNKKGLYLFGILAVVACFSTYPTSAVSIFSQPIIINVAVMPVVYLALITCFHKHGKDETRKLFFIILIAMSSLFVCKFFEAAYMDSYVKAQVFLTWNYLGKYIGSIVAFACSSALTLFLTTKINVKSLQNFLKLALYLLIASTIDVIVYIVLVYTGIMAFGNMLLTMLISIVIVSAVCLFLGYFEKFFNRKLAPATQVEKTQEPTKDEKSTTTTENNKTDEATEQNNQENKKDAEEEILTPDDID